MTYFLSAAGRRMLDRRAFLQFGGTGLSSIALAALLHEQKLLGAEPPIRPAITTGCGVVVSFDFAAARPTAPAGSSGSTNWPRTVATSTSAHAGAEPATRPSSRARARHHVTAARRAAALFLVAAIVMASPP